MATNLFGQSEGNASKAQLGALLYRLGRAIEELQTITAGTGVDNTAELNAIISELQDVNTELDAQSITLADSLSELGGIHADTTAIDTTTNAINNSVQALDANNQTSFTDINSELDSITTETQGINTELDSQTVLLTSIESVSTLIQGDTASILSDTSGILVETQSINTELDSQTALLTTIDGDTGTIATNTGSTNSELAIANSEFPRRWDSYTVDSFDAGATNSPTQITYKLSGVNQFRHTMVYGGGASTFELTSKTVTLL